MQDSSLLAREGKEDCHSAVTAEHCGNATDGVVRAVSHKQENYRPLVWMLIFWKYDN